MNVFFYVYRGSFTLHVTQCSLNFDKSHKNGNSFLTYETEFVLFLFVLFLAVRGNSVLPIGWGSSHATLKVSPEL